MRLWSLLSLATGFRLSDLGVGVHGRLRRQQQRRVDGRRRQHDAGPEQPDQRLRGSRGRDGRQRRNAAAQRLLVHVQRRQPERDGPDLRAGSALGPSASAGAAGDLRRHGRRPSSAPGTQRVRSPFTQSGPVAASGARASARTCSAAAVDGGTYTGPKVATATWAPTPASRSGRWRRSTPTRTLRLKVPMTDETKVEDGGLASSRPPTSAATTGAPQFNLPSDGTWKQITVKFSDATFKQEGWGTVFPWNPAHVTSIQIPVHRDKRALRLLDRRRLLHSVAARSTLSRGAFRRSGRAAVLFPQDLLIKVLKEVSADESRAAAGFDDWFIRAGARMCRRQADATPVGSGGSGQRDRPGRLRRQQPAADAVQGDVHRLPAEPIVDGDVPAERGRHLRRARLGRGRRTVRDRAAGEHAVPQQLAASALPVHGRRGPVRDPAARPQPGQRLVVYTSDTTWTMDKKIWTALAVHTRDMPIEVTVRSAPPAAAACQLGSKVHFTIAPVGRERQAGLLVDVGDDLLQRPADRHRDRAERLRGR